MKVERPPHHKPLSKEDAASSNDTGGEDITECFSRLSICNADSSKSVKNNILPDVKKCSSGADEPAKKEDEKEGSVRKREGEKKAVEKEDDEVKQKKDGEVQKEPAGDLLPRGPIAVDPKWKSASLTSRFPYPTSTQSNCSRTNGGYLLYDSQSAASFPGLGFEESFSSELYNTIDVTQHLNYVTGPGINHGDNFNQLITPQNLPADNSDFLDPLQQQNIFEQDTPVSASFPDEALREFIQAVTSDPVKVESLVKDIESEASKLNAPLIDLTSDKTTHSTKEQRCSYSPIQVVPQRRTSLSSLSAYSTCSGSPSDPASPNFYGNIPNFSPNVPSPQVNLCDDSSNTMYSSPCYTMLQSPLQRPLSSCSSSSTNCSSTDLDGFDLIFRPSNVEDKEKIQAITEYLDTSCSEDYKAKLQSNCLGAVQTTNSPIVMMVYGLPNQPSFQKRPSDCSSASGRRAPRVILPKPTDRNMLPSLGEKPANIQEFLQRQLAKQSKLPQKQSTHPQPAKEQLLQRLDPVKKSRAWARAQSPKDEEIAAVDADGDTALMMLVCHSDILQKLEQLYALVERYKTIPGLLALRNNDKQSALYMACMMVHHEPLIAKYIAEALLDINADLNVRDETDGSMLIHQLCKGDKYSAVLDDLLSLKDRRGKRCFDINITDYEGRTPLHLSVETHNSGIPCLEIVKVLLRHGANVLERDGKQGSTALHLALSTKKPDETLVHTLCNFGDSVTDKVVQGTESYVKSDLVNAKNFKGDTPLHVAMAYGGSIESQTHNYILEILLGAGGARAIRNHNGKAPLELAPEARKAEIKRILDKFSAK